MLLHDLDAVGSRQLLKRAPLVDDHDCGADHGSGEHAQQITAHDGVTLGVGQIVGQPDVDGLDE